MRILDLLPSRQLSQVAKLQLLAREIVEGFSSGRHRSPHQGFSVEFKQHRPYVRGDELRSIDWKVFGKSDRLYIRESEADTNLRCTLVVDCSGSMQYRGSRFNRVRKSDFAQQTAAALAYLMLNQQDAVGAITFDDHVSNFIPPRSRPSHLQPILQALVKAGNQRESDIGGAFEEIAPRLPRRGLLIIISDMMSDMESIGRALAQLRAAKHEILLFQILDPDEVDFPFRGRIQFCNLENQSDQKTIDATSLRAAYQQRFEHHQNQLRDVCRRHHVDWMQLTTDRSPADALQEYLAARQRMA